MTKKEWKKENRGSTLLLVIMAVSFIAILAAAALSLSATNLKMKSIETKAKKNFYSAESALDEIKAGLETELANIVEEVYTETMISYSDLSEGEKTKVFKQEFLKKYLKTYAAAGSLPQAVQTSAGQVTYNKNLLEGYLDKTKENATVKDVGGRQLCWILDEKDAMNQYMTFCNVTIEYQGSDQLLSRICTDIKIQIPDLSMEAIDTLPPFTEYALIADRQLLIEKAAASVAGNVFAGSRGVLAAESSSKLSISGAKLITKDGIVAKDGASILLQGECGQKSTLDIWARNIETAASSVNTEYSPSISATGNCYIADDTTLNAKNSTVTLAGSYYGYGYQESPSESSAIIINRQKCTLDLKKIRNLFVAGRAYIEPADGESHADEDYVSTGESITVKGNQIAYRLPAEALKAATNPMPLKEYQAVLDGKEAMVNLDYVLPFANKKLRYYVEETKPYRTIFDQTGSTAYVYLYPNFKSAAKANEYMQAYYKSSDSSYMEAVRQRMQQYESNVFLPDNMNKAEGRKTFSGNVIGYDARQKAYSLYQNSVDAVLPQQFAKESDELARMYEAYCKRLTPSISEADASYETMFDALIIARSDDPEHPGMFELLGGRKSTTIREAGYGAAYLIENENKEAFTVDAKVEDDVHLIVATGDVTVKRDFAGLIICKGTVRLENGVHVQADSAAIFDLISHTKAKHIFRDYNSFGSYLMTRDEEPIEFASLITYENWKKE